MYLNLLELSTQQVLLVFNLKNLASRCTTFRPSGNVEFTTLIITAT